MVRNIVILGGNSHPSLCETICEMLGMSVGQALFSKFAVGETRVEIGESVRGKDVYIVQSGGGKVNDHFIELCIAISACKTASAKKVTAVLPLFPYSRQSDIPYNKSGGRSQSPCKTMLDDQPCTRTLAYPSHPRRSSVSEEHILKYNCSTSRESLEPHQQAGDQWRSLHLRQHPFNSSSRPKSVEWDDKWHVEKHVEQSTSGRDRIRHPTSSEPAESLPRHQLPV